MKKLTSVTLFFLLIGLNLIQAQSLEELKAMKAEKEAMASEIKAKLDPIQAEIDALNAKIEKFPGWKLNFFGTLGANFSAFNDWIAAGDNGNSQSQTLVGNLNAMANFDQAKTFLYNALVVNLGALKQKNEGQEATPWQKIPDALDLSSLFGYKLLPTLALSSGMTYKTSLLNRFNNPGDLDLGAGATWTPNSDFFLMVHPVNYHWKFGDNPDFNSALGAKIKAVYVTELVPGLAWSSTLQGFYAYQNFDPSAHWYEWQNTLAFTIFKGIGVGVNFAVRRADAEILKTQTRWSTGLSYVL